VLLYIPVAILVYSLHFPSLQSIFHFILLFPLYHYLACH
jgi:hypothetical protein